MDPIDEAKLRMQCLELAKQVAIASCSGTYTIVPDAGRYWEFVKGEKKATSAPPKTDDIPF